jgi:hypothetical protein
MTNYARFDGDTVAEITGNPKLYHPALAAQFAPVPDDIRPGWKLSGDGWAPPAPTPDLPTPPVVEDRRITRLAFLKRFTLEERAVITAAQQTDIVVADVMLFVTVSEYIDLNGEDAQQGLQALVAKGLIKEPRAGEILAAPVQLSERPSNWTPQA